MCYQNTDMMPTKVVFIKQLQVKIKCQKICKSYAHLEFVPFKEQLPNTLF